jgi:predicted enzyme related to lactoylglutathione lyase
MTASATIASITFDCADARALAEFWAALLDRSVAAGATEAYAELQGAPGMTFIAVPEAKTAKNRVHLDVMVEDLDAAVRHAVSIGATTAAEFDEGGYRWVTLADPDGNEFDLAAKSG